MLHLSTACILVHKFCGKYTAAPCFKEYKTLKLIIVVLFLHDLTHHRIKKIYILCYTGHTSYVDINNVQ